MTIETAYDLRFPIGDIVLPDSLDPAARLVAIDRIEQLPSNLRAAVAGLTDEQLDTPYRPQGWTVRQVVHHIVDSHVNAFTRFRLGLTEDSPTIRPYDQDKWANLPDASDDIEPSLDLVDALHRRLVISLRTIKPEEWTRLINHPESGVQSLDALLANYSWHGDHHVAHITSLRRRRGW